MLQNSYTFPVRKNILLLFVLIVGVASVFSACTASGASRPTAVSHTPRPNVKKETVHLAPADGFDQTGTATIEDLGDKKVRVFIRIDHSADSVLPASLNTGDCSAIEGVKTPLQDVKNGNSDTLLTNTAMNDVQTLSVVVYHPQGDPRPTVCGFIE
jgi:hypothetical protein